MSSTIPKSQLIFGYLDLLKTEPPADRLGLLKGMCKEQVVGEIARLNYMLKPKEVKFQDTSLETQREELFYMCGEEPALHKKYVDLIDAFALQKNDYPILFTRASCLFATEEVLGSDLALISSFTMRGSWEKLLQYLLAVNTAITRIQNSEPPRAKETREPKDETKKTEIEVEEEEELHPAPAPLWERLNSKIIVLNELTITTDPIYTAFRGGRLLQFLTDHPALGNHVTGYLRDCYDMTFQHFIYEFLSMYAANNEKGVNNITTVYRKRTVDTSFIFYPSPASEQLFKTLSQVIANRNPATLLSVRKFPFFKAKKGYFLLDNIFLVEKCYGQFINDFWFDKIKPLVNPAGKPEYDIRRYRAIIGAFLEGYLGEILTYCFAQVKHFRLYTFDQLKITVGKNLIELSDVYLRLGDKLFLAEVKSTSIYDKEKYSYDVDSLYKNDRAAFFDSFGIGQLVHALELLTAHAASFDGAFPSTGSLKVYPAIIVNEKALQTPLMAKIFNDRFQELLSDKIDKRLKVQPLSLVHISDWENMTDHLRVNPRDFFRILKFHVRAPAFMPPFYNTLIRKDIQPTHERTKPWIEEIVLTHQAQPSPPIQR